MHTLARILGVSVDALAKLEGDMSARTGKHGVLAAVEAENEQRMQAMLTALGVSGRSGGEVREALSQAIRVHERQLKKILDEQEGDTPFERAAALARAVARVGKGYFLKKSYAEEILRRRPPAHLLSFLGYRSVDELFAHHDVTEAFSALRFMESDEWMHETFEIAYSAFTPADFEERAIEIKVLGSEWHEVAAKFVEKKHHNVSHLKEFGVIFLNPIAEDVEGKTLRDFALLLHYFHEIEFYSKLFRSYAARDGFATHLKALLRGDVKEVNVADAGEWLIVQRYLFKENPSDPRLFLPRVNPESLHWARGERDLARYGSERKDLALEVWDDFDWVGGFFDGDDDLVSFDLEDNAMNVVSKVEGKNDRLSYHQREALWTKIFREYAGGEEGMERLLIEHFEHGAIHF